MKLIRTIAMPTDHSYHGTPIETSRVELFISDDIEWTPEMIAKIKENQEKKLHSMAKKMPHSYWIKQKARGK